MYLGIWHPNPLIKTKPNSSFFQCRSTVLSKNIVPKIKKCDILPTVQSKLFDHKAICINFNRTKLPVTIPTVSPKIVNDPDLPILVEIAVLEIYTRYSAIPSAEQRQVSLGIFMSLPPSASGSRTGSSLRRRRCTVRQQRHRTKDKEY